MNLLMIAPCGMNCGICLANLRDKNVCNGCWSTTGHKANSRINCSIKNCDFLAKTNLKFCYECTKFPCTRLKQLDKRYRLKYNMSMTENLQNIERAGLENFIQMEMERWKCVDCGGTICVHRGYCLKCNDQKNPGIKIRSMSTEN